MAHGMGAGALAGCEWTPGGQPRSTAIEESAVAGETEVIVDVLRLLSPKEEAKPA